jgi:hypothetical protein
VDDEKISKKGADLPLRRIARASRNLPSQRGVLESEATSTPGLDGKPNSDGKVFEAGDAARRSKSIFGSAGSSGQVEQVG